MVEAYRAMAAFFVSVLLWGLNASPAYPVTLDSSLAFGGTREDTVTSMALGPDGSLFIAGRSASRDVPKQEAGSFGRQVPGAYIAKFDGVPIRLRWVRILGGSGHDIATSISVLRDGTVLFAGHTWSNDFGGNVGFPPVDIEGGRDLFVGAFNADGELQDLEVIQGDGFESDPVIAGNPSGGWTVAATTTSGRFSGFTTIGSGAPGGGDGVLLFVGSAGERDAYFLGGSGADSIADMALGDDGTITVVGKTRSTDFPTIGAVQPINGGGVDGFIARFVDRDMVWATFVGGPGDDEISAVDVGPSGEVAVAGTVQSDGLSTPGVEQETRNGVNDPLVMLWRGEPLAVVWSTYLGGGPGGGFEFFREEARGVALTSSGGVVVSGQATADFPLKDPLYQFNGGVTDAFVAELNNEGGLEFSTYLGGIRFDASVDVAVRSDGLIQVVGTSGSPDFPLLGPGAFELRGSQDVTVTSLRSSGGLRHCGVSWSPLSPTVPIVVGIDTASGRRLEHVRQELHGNGITGVGFTDSGEMFILLTGQIAFPQGTGAQVFPRAGVAFYESVSLRPSAMIRTSADVTAATAGQGANQLVVLTSRNILVADTATHTVAVGPMEVGGRALALSADRQSLFIAAWDGLVELSAVDLSLKQELDFAALDLVIDDRGMVVLIDDIRSEILRIDATGGSIDASVAIRPFPSSLAVRGSKAYVTHGDPSGTALGGVTVIDLDQEQILREVILDGPTASVVYDEDTDVIYFAQRDGRWFAMDGESDHLRQVNLGASLPTGGMTVTRSLACNALQYAEDCPGDCDRSGVVSVNELVQAVLISLGLEALSACPAADANRDLRVSIGDLVSAVNAALAGCPRGSELS